MITNSRRQFLKIAGVLSLSTLFPNILLSSDKIYEKSIALHSIHTGESLNTIFWAEGKYDLNAIYDINHILRDFRTNISTNMDIELIELLYNIKHVTNSSRFFEVISGYRHPSSNLLLHKTTSGVANKSLHMEGKAIDINMPGINLKDLHKIAMNIRAGGVGYYPDSNFIHVDTGRIRAW
jgi:uncharacterized protein YcbK (DUF882 family)